MADAHFSPALFRFLRELARHNDREWFTRNRERYEREVRDPMLRFIGDLARPLSNVSAHVVADPRPVSGSMFRIYRDVRFSKDKRPYKTHAAAHFRHDAGRNVHAPGFYLHLEPGDVFFGAGIWHPDPGTLAAIRSACSFDGESAARPPRGIDPDHPLIEDLKRKDFTVIADSSENEATSPRFLERFVRFCRAVSPLNEFLARSLGLGW
jgi:uncharacterized protein (DUF2461 family)